MEWTLYLRTIFALIFVLGLIGAASWAVRRFGLGQGRMGRKGRRLQVVESLTIDNRRRLVLVRRDGAEHLLMVGGAVELVVERNIATKSELPEEQEL